MKANHFGNYSWTLAALAFTCSIGNAIAVEISPSPTATLEMTSETGAATTQVRINDAFNHVWVLQHSGDFTNWTDVGVFKIYNGSFATNLGSVTTSPNLFFRAYYDSSR